MIEIHENIVRHATYGNTLEYDRQIVEYTRLLLAENKTVKEVIIELLQNDIEHSGYIVRAAIEWNQLEKKLWMLYTRDYQSLTAMYDDCAVWHHKGFRVLIQGYSAMDCREYHPD